MAISDRVRKLRELHGIKSDFDLLVMLYAECGFEDPYLEATKGKYNFSKMLNGTRPIKHDFIIPLEKIFNVPFDYIQNGNEIKVNDRFTPRGLEYTVVSKDINEFIKLNDEIDKFGNYVIFNKDEYGYSIIDYILKYESIIGVEFFVKNLNMTYNPKEDSFEIKQIDNFFNDYKKLTYYISNIIIKNENVDLFNQLFNGISIIRFHQEEKAIYHEQKFINDILNSEEIYKSNLWLKKFPLYRINRKKNNERLISGVFVNPLVNYFFENLVDSANPDETRILKLLKWGYRCNSKILNFMIETVKTNRIFEITESGFLKLDNYIYGNVFYPKAKNIDSLNEKCQEVIKQNNELLELIKQQSCYGFDGIKKINYIIEGDYIYRPSVNNPVAYKLYEMGNKYQIPFIPRYLGTENGMDKFTIYKDFYLVKGCKGADLVDVMRFLHSFHDLCEKEFGEGNVIVHNNLSQFNVFFNDNFVTGIVNWDYCKFGNKFEDLLYLMCHWLALDEDPDDRDNVQLVSNIHTVVDLFQCNKEEYENLSNQMIGLINKNIEMLDKSNESYNDTITLYKRIIEFINSNREEIDNVIIKNTSRQRNYMRVLNDKDLIGNPEFKENKE